MSNEIRMLGNYEITQSIYIGDKKVVFGVDTKDPHPFMVCYCDYHNPLSAAWPTEGVVIAAAHHKGIRVFFIYAEHDLFISDIDALDNLVITELSLFLTHSATPFALFSRSAHLKSFGYRHRRK